LHAPERAVVEESRPGRARTDVERTNPGVWKPRGGRRLVQPPGEAKPVTATTFVAAIPATVLTPETSTVPTSAPAPAVQTTAVTPAASAKR
jgi:hypothetical protein